MRSRGRDLKKPSQRVVKQVFVLVVEVELFEKIEGKSRALEGRHELRDKADTPEGGEED